MHPYNSIPYFNYNMRRGHSGDRFFGGGLLLPFLLGGIAGGAIARSNYYPYYPPYPMYPPYQTYYNNFYY